MKYLFISVMLMVSMAMDGLAQVPPYVPGNGLIAWWPFSGNAVDSSGNNHHGTVTNAVLTADRFGNENAAYSFSGTQQIDMGTSPVFALTKSKYLSVSYWTKSTTGPHPVISKYQAGVPINSNYFFGASAPNFPHAIRVVGRGSNFWDISLPPDLWNHVVLAFNGYIDSVYIYINGVFYDRKYIVLETNISTRPLLFGPRQSADYPVTNGLLDDVGFWNRVLTSDEVKGLYVLDLQARNVGIGVVNPQRSLHVRDVLRLEPRAAPPDNPVKGDMYFDGILNKLRVYDGTTWQNCW